ncbi:hypothetical protein IU433_01780 [Nocardia puris]|uniref:hypothetical protein n=1 Tax=Nocardia puris TaxID=208602 RepID=UPI0018943157|nr:hypothetical protein [Nocardia puris]MBF6210516.1 hypothetical protein [Nocardia puris]MBF6369241.1 hypothetical protein [Nocardia puris]MBF6457776.1 hypothetical protein [Nocardia puris]
MFRTLAKPILLLGLAVGATLTPATLSSAAPDLTGPVLPVAYGAAGPYDSKSSCESARKSAIDDEKVKWAGPCFEKGGTKANPRYYFEHY